MNKHPTDKPVDGNKHLLALADQLVHYITSHNQFIATLQKLETAHRESGSYEEMGKILEHDNLLFPEKNLKEILETKKEEFILYSVSSALNRSREFEKILKLYLDVCDNYYYSKDISKSHTVPTKSTSLSIKNNGFTVKCYDSDGAKQEETTKLLYHTFQAEIDKISDSEYIIYCSELLNKNVKIKDYKQAIEDYKSNKNISNIIKYLEFNDLIFSGIGDITLQIENEAEVKIYIIASNVIFSKTGVLGLPKVKGQKPSGQHHVEMIFLDYMNSFIEVNQIKIKNALIHISAHSGDGKGQKDVCPACRGYFEDHVKYSPLTLTLEGITQKFNPKSLQEESKPQKEESKKAETRKPNPKKK